jgi:hypothetical protein
MTRNQRLAIIATVVFFTGCGKNMTMSFSALSTLQTTGSGDTAAKNPGGGAPDPTDPTAGDDSCDRAQAQVAGATVRMCHVPEGNPAAKHVICPDAAGALNGHGIDPSKPSQIGMHGGDYLGNC